ncbi:MAG TPA: hypothetical protein VF282_10130, partial [Bacillota bacterium]
MNRFRAAACVPVRPSRAALRAAIVAALLAGVLLAAAGCGLASGAERETLTLYSSRTRSLVHPLLEEFARET